MPLTMFTQQPYTANGLTLVANKLLSADYYILGISMQAITNPKLCPPTYAWNSWASADVLCEVYAEHSNLPKFYDRDEMEELLSIIKLHPNIFGIHALYIGLEINAKKQVYI